jgi:hypothetical protein
MEQRFGYDFSRVRVHSGLPARQSAQDLNALAYTVGSNIVFGEGQLSRGTHEGRRLIAHELTHVVQQSGAEKIGESNDERGLSAFSNPVASTFRPVATTAPQIARQAAPAFGRTCSGGAADPCQLARCSPGQQATAAADIARGLGYVNAAVAALAAVPLSGFTSRAMDWYFGGHDPATVATVSTRMACIAKPDSPADRL